MKYLQPSFSTAAPGDQQYRDNWDRIFAKKYDACVVETDDGPVLYTTGQQIGEPVQMKYPFAISGDQTYTEMVREFHTVFSQPIVEKPAVPEAKRVQLRLRLIKEEFFELLAACEIWPEGAGLTASGLVDDSIADDFSGHVDIVEFADALADLVYVIEGAALEFGIDLPAVMAEVHRSNLSKLGPDGKPIYNEFGKVIKPATYSPPDIAKVLNVGR